MARTLHDDMADDFAAILAADEFAEDGVYLPGHGLREVELRAIVKAIDTDQQNRPSELVEVEAIEVRISNDPDLVAQGVTCGGVERPRIGAGFVRAGDQIDDAYGLVKVLGHNSHSWRLRFERETPTRIGTGNIKTS